MAKCTFMLGNFYSIFCNYHPVELTKQQWILAVQRNLLIWTHFDPIIEHKVSITFWLSEVF